MEYNFIVSVYKRVSKVRNKMRLLNEEIRSICTISLTGILLVTSSKSK